MSLNGGVKLAAVVLLVRLMLDVGTPLLPGAFVLRPTGIEGVGVGGARSGAPPVTLPEPTPHLRREATLLVHAAATVRSPIAPPRRPAHRMLRLPPESDGSARPDLAGDH